MPLRFIVFLLIVTTLVVSSHGYVGWSLIAPSGLVGSARSAAWAAVVAFAMLPLLGFAGRFLVRDPAIADVLAWIGFTAMGLFSFVFVFTLLRDVVWLVMKASSTLPGDPGRRQAFLHGSNLVLWGGSAELTALGTLGARRRADVVDVDVPIINLPAALEGFTIAQITDLHVGPTIKKAYVDAIVDAVNELRADVVAVTGDIVDGSVFDLSEHVAPLGRLRGKHGVFVCTGNHEYYSGAEA